MTGSVVFVSKSYGGSASDVYISRNSGLIDLLEEGDAVMVDKGFFHLNTDLRLKALKCIAHLLCQQLSSSLQRNRLSLQDVLLQHGYMLRGKWNKLRISKFYRELCL